MQKNDAGYSAQSEKNERIEWTVALRMLVRETDLRIQGIVLYIRKYKTSGKNFGSVEYSDGESVEVWPSAEDVELTIARVN